jgi:hypothetical protein
MDAALDDEDMIAMINIVLALTGVLTEAAPGRATAIFRGHFGERCREACGKISPAGSELISELLEKDKVLEMQNLKALEQLKRRTVNSMAIHESRTYSVNGVKSDRIPVLCDGVFTGYALSFKHNYAGSTWQIYLGDRILIGKAGKLAEALEKVTILHSEQATMVAGSSDAIL